MVEKIKEKRIVIVGSGGMLGSDLVRVFPDAVKLTHSMLDITKKEDVLLKLSRLEPDVVINAAAYTDVEGAESERSAAYLLNSTAVLYLSEACREIGSVLVHYSTDYVFDGKKETGYGEDDEAHPLNEYGRSKREGEVNILNTLSRFYIIRTSWLFGCNGKNFVNIITKRARENDEIKVVNDQFGCPTYSYDLARMTEALLFEKYPFGIYHLTNDGYCTWFEFARKIISLQNIECRVLPCSSCEYPSRLVRPRYSILNNNKTGKMPPWKDALERCLSSRV